MRGPEVLSDASVLAWCSSLTPGASVLLEDEVISGFPTLASVSPPTGIPVLSKSLAPADGPVPADDPAVVDGPALLESVAHTDDSTPADGVTLAFPAYNA